MIPNNDIWKVITNGESKGIPVWICRMRLSEISDFVREQRFSYKTGKVDLSYIRFLEEQIALGARGPEWGEILKKRLSALREYVGRAVTTVMIARGDLTVTNRIDPEALTILDVEEV